MAESRITTDTSELRAFAADLRGSLPAELNRLAYPIVKKAAQNVKEAMIDDFKGHPHFDQIAPSVSYDINVRSFGGVLQFEAEIGPDHERHGGALANIAYFGGSRGGGGTVPDPERHLEGESPRMEKALLDLIAEVW
jgi:prepilin-type processing-associated H-X9-DG protein